MYPLLFIVYNNLNFELLDAEFYHLAIPTKFTENSGLDFQFKPNMCVDYI
jgi:hypothetical protein